MAKYKGALVHTITEADVGGKNYAETSRWGFGPILPQDVGKQVQMHDGVYRMENAKQFGERMESERTATGMARTTKQTLEAISFTTKQVDKKPCPWDALPRPHWRLHFSLDGRRTSFDFWNNVHNETPEKYEVLDMLLGNATSTIGQDVDEFAEEYGYTKPSEAIRVYKACQSVLRKLARLFQCDEDGLYDCANVVVELYTIGGLETWAE